MVHLYELYNKTRKQAVTSSSWKDKLPSVSELKVVAAEHKWSLIEDEIFAKAEFGPTYEFLLHPRKKYFCWFNTELLADADYRMDYRMDDNNNDERTFSPHGIVWTWFVYDFKAKTMREFVPVDDHSTRKLVWKK